MTSFIDGTSITPSPFSLDIDGNGQMDPLTDGILMMRYDRLNLALLNLMAFSSCGSTTGILFLQKRSIPILIDTRRSLPIPERIPDFHEN